MGIKRTFYDPKGKVISKERFIEFYSDAYYIQNSQYIEENIEEILYNGINTKMDIINILAWKIGKIKHLESQTNGEYVYYSDWAETIETNPNQVKYRGKEMHLKPFLENIEKDKERLEKFVTGSNEDDPQEVLNQLNSYLGNTVGIGTVYLVTLLYFISKGRYPIYDRFAQMAVTAIKNDNKPNSEKNKVSYKELPDRMNQGKFKKIVENNLRSYWTDIDDIFGIDKYQENRNIDRALWVYGHLFYSG
ncbi:MAG: hypothetical protein K2K70_01565 [Lachnospiraceae bacterium]|nr:hypothetical protein [Lachnospiraceae bacterium]